MDNMEQAPQESLRELLGLPIYNALQREIIRRILAMNLPDYSNEEVIGEDVSDDMRHIIKEDRDKVLAAFQGQKEFSPAGHEDLIQELVKKVLERAPYTKGEW